jgi:hypothetical protein
MTMMEDENLIAMAPVPADDNGAPPPPPFERFRCGGCNECSVGGRLAHAGVDGVLAWKLCPAAHCYVRYLMPPERALAHLEMQRERGVVARATMLLNYDALLPHCAQLLEAAGFLLHQRDQLRPHWRITRKSLMRRIHAADTRIYPGTLDSALDADDVRRFFAPQGPLALALAADAGMVPPIAAAAAAQRHRHPKRVLEIDLDDEPSTQLDEPALQLAVARSVADENARSRFDVQPELVAQLAQAEATRPPPPPEDPNMTGKFLCSVCVERFTWQALGFNTTCGHGFCYECLRKCITCGHRACPRCRATMTANTILRFYGVG